MHQGLLNRFNWVVGRSALIGECSARIFYQSLNDWWSLGRRWGHHSCQWLEVECRENYHRRALVCLEGRLFGCWGRLVSRERKWHHKGPSRTSRQSATWMPIAENQVNIRNLPWLPVLPVECEMNLLSDNDPKTKSSSIGLRTFELHCMRQKKKK